MRKFTQSFAALCLLGLCSAQVAKAEDAANGLVATYYSWTEDVFTRMKQGGDLSDRGTEIPAECDLFSGNVVGTFTAPSGAAMNYDFADVLGQVSRDGGGDFFSARLTGFIKAPATKIMQFKYWGDNGLRLWIDKVADTDDCVINWWKNDWEQDQLGSFEMVKDQVYKIRMDYFDDWGGNVIKLYWDADGLENFDMRNDAALVPTTALFQTNPVTAVNNVNAQEIALYPNPTSDFITISNVGKANITISDVAGKIVKSVVNTGNDATISVSDLSKGVYFAKIGADTKKFIVK